MTKVKVPLILAIGLLGLGALFCFRDELLYRVGISGERTREYFDVKKSSDAFNPVLVDPAINWRRPIARPSAGRQYGWRDWTLLTLVGVLGTGFALILSQRSASPSDACIFGVAIMWLAYLAPPILLEPFYRFAVFPYRIAGIPVALFVAIHLSVLLLPWLFFGRSDPQSNSPTSAFGSLAFYSLPWGVFSKVALTVRHEGEQAYPEQGMGWRMLELLDGVILVVKSKGDGEISLWRCGGESNERMLLLVERRLGFLRKVWCLVEVNKLGSDVSIKVHALTPRNLDYRDYTLLRFLLFPMDIAGGIRHVENRWDGGGGSSEHVPRSALAFAVLLILSGLVLIGLAIAGTVSTGREVVGVGTAFASLCIWVALLLRASESIAPTPVVQRAASELMHLTQQAVISAVTPMKRLMR